MLILLFLDIYPAIIVLEYDTIIDMHVIETKKTRWIDIVKTTAQSIEFLKKEFNIHPVVLKELEEPSVRTRVDNFDKYLFLVYQFPVYNSVQKVSQRAEIDILITKHDVVTVHYDHFDFLGSFAQNLEEDESAKDAAMENSLQLTYHLLQTILNFGGRQLHHIGKNVEEVSASLFQKREKEVLEKISYLKRDILEYRIILHSVAPVLKSLIDVGADFWGKEAKPYLEDINGDYLKYLNQLEDYRAAVVDFEQTNNQLLNMRTTEIMKLFTVLAFFTFPLTLVSGLFSMRTESTPIIGLTGDFWIITGGMVLFAITLFIFIKLKKWL